MGYKVGVDVGGTFTDFLMVDEEGKVKIYKSPSTPADPSIGLLNGLEDLAREHGLKLKEFAKEIDIIVHGTTVTTNAILTRNGAKTGLLTTKGFRDILQMRRGEKEEMYNLKYKSPEPLVNRYLTRTTEERMDYKGDIIAPLKKEEVIEALKLFKREGIEAVAVCYMHSYMNPKHEDETAELLKEMIPDAYVTLSSKLLPKITLYDRISTTVMNSYVGPIIRKYLNSLTAKLADIGFHSVLLIMQSNGGVMSPEVAVRSAASTLLSGPAGGPVAGIFYAGIHGHKDSITVDMGGTSFDCTTIINQMPTVITTGQISHLRIALPMLGMNTIGAGGGSIAWIDAGGFLQVGPRSAGAEPGPVCYDSGGVLPTVTDADLVLGYLDKDYFLGGKMKLNRDKAQKVIEEKIAKLLGLDVFEGAAGIFQVVNVNMADGIREITTKRGVDPREFPLIVAGGAGPVHAGQIANELEIKEIIVPKHSSIFCAAGMLMSNLRHDFVRTYQIYFTDINPKRFITLYDSMVKEAESTLVLEGIPKKDIKLIYTIDVRYTYQWYEVNIEITEKEYRECQLESIAKKFHTRFEELYGYSLKEQPLELMNLRVIGIGETVKPNFRPLDFAGEDSSGCWKRKRKVYLREKEEKGNFREIDVFDGDSMGFGNKVTGPAIIEQATTSILVLPQYNLMCDRYGSYVVYLKDKEEEIQNRFQEN
jgi:N-methylhydantoinase A